MTASVLKQFVIMNDVLFHHFGCLDLIPLCLSERSPWTQIHTKSWKELLSFFKKIQLHVFRCGRPLIKDDSAPQELYSYSTR